MKIENKEWAIDMLMDGDADPSTHVHGDLSPAVWGLIKPSLIIDRGSADSGSGNPDCVFLAMF